MCLWGGEGVCGDGVWYVCVCVCGEGVWCVCCL